MAATFRRIGRALGAAALAGAIMAIAQEAGKQDIPPYLLAPIMALLLGADKAIRDWQYARTHGGN